MNPGKRRRPCRCNTRLHFLSSPLLFLSLILPASSLAQITSDNTHPTVSGAPDLTALAASTLPTTFSTTTVISTAITASPSLSQSTQISSTLSRVTKDNAPPLQPAPTSSATSAASDTNSIDRESHLLNYYFVFLALAGVAVCVAGYMIHRRRRRRKAQFHNSGQTALARDLDGWVNTRRWYYGSGRGGLGGSLARREEGLDEHGEAPPPYKPRADATTDTPGIAGGTTVLPSGEDHDAVTGLSIPLRTLSRAGRATLKPPGYQETIHPISVGEGAVPKTTEIQADTSTGGLLQASRRPSNPAN